MKKIIAVALVAMMLTGCSTSTLKTGVGMITSRSSIAPTQEQAGKIQTNTTTCSLTVDEKGKIVGIAFDVTQAAYEIDTEGKVTNDISEEVVSKKALKDNYGMKKNSGIGKEWYEQAQAFESWAKGKTVDEVLNMTTKVKDEKHPAVPDVADLATSVTIDVSDFLAAVKAANENAK